MNMPGPEYRSLVKLENLTVAGFKEDEMEYIHESQRELMYVGVLRGGRGMETFMPLADRIVDWMYLCRDKVSTFSLIDRLTARLTFQS